MADDLSQRLLNHTFTSYKSNAVPELSPHLGFIQDHLASYLYNKYLTTNSDLIVRFKSPQDVHVKLKVHQYNEITYLLISSNYLVSNQLVVWVPTGSSMDYNTLVLIKSPIPSFLVNCLLSIDHSPPLVLSKKTLSNNNLTQLIDSLAQKLQFSHLHIIYESALGNDSLKNITVELGQSDLAKLASNKPLFSGINRYFEEKTGLRLQNLPILKISSDHLVISSDGKFKVLNSSVDMVECLTAFG